MSEMTEMLSEVVEKIFKNHVKKETVDLVEKGQWAKDVWDILCQHEIPNVAIAESLGGAGGDLADLYYLYQLIGQYTVPIPFVETTLTNYFLQILQLPITSHKATYCITSNNVHLNTDNTLSGTLENVAWARHVDELFLLASNEQGIYGVHIALSNTSINPSTNLASEPRDHITLENTPIKQKTSQPLTDEQLNWLQTIHTAAKNALITGAINKAFDLTVRYTKEREQFGRPIHRFQLVQQHLAILAGEQAISNAAFENMVAAINENRQQNEVALTAIRLDEATKIVATSAHQVHAAIGVTHEHSLHHYTRRLWAWRDEGLTASYWKNMMANELLNLKQDNLWTYLTNAEGPVIAGYSS